jgi:AcrR family transcriptional regulator
MTDTRTRILDVALELFSEHGYEGTALQQIADRVGLTKAALYYHFRSKDDLLEALLAPAVTELDRVLDVAEARPQNTARRRRFVEDYLDYLLRHRRLMAYMSRDIATLAHPVIATGNRRRRERIEALLAGHEVGFGDQIRAAMAFGGIQAVIVQYPDVDAAELRAALLRAASTLLRAGTPGRRRPAAATALTRPSPSGHPARITTTTPTTGRPDARE